MACSTLEKLCPPHQAAPTAGPTADDWVVDALLRPVEHGASQLAGRGRPLPPRKYKFGAGPTFRPRDIPCLPFARLACGRVLGEGASARVYEGRHRGVTVAVKMAKDKAEAGCLLQEAHVTRLLAHENVVGVDCLVTGAGGIVEGFAMPAAAHTLVDLIEDGTLAGMDWPDRVRLCHGVAAGVAHLHSKGYVHHDLKSENILVTGDGRALLADCGIARPMAPGRHTFRGGGTHTYWAPEQYVNQMSQASEVYSLGLVMCEAVSARPCQLPAKDRYARGRLLARGLRPHIPSGLPPSVRDVIASCINGAPEDRPSAADIVQTLERLLNAPRYEDGLHDGGFAGNQAAGWAAAFPEVPPRALRGFAGPAQDRAPRQGRAAMYWGCGCPDGARPILDS